MQHNLLALDSMTRAKNHKINNQINEAFAEYLKVAVMDDPELSAEAYFRCWEIAFEKENYNEGMVYFLKGKELNPNIGDLLENHNELIDEATKRIDDRWIKRAEDYIRRGNIYLVKNMLNEAEADALTAINETSNGITRFKAFFFLGNVDFAKQDYFTAYDNYWKALEFLREFTAVLILATFPINYATGPIACNITHIELQLLKLIISFNSQKARNIGIAIESWLMLKINPFVAPFIFEHLNSFFTHHLEQLLLSVKQGDIMNELSRSDLLKAIESLPEDKQQQFLELRLDREQTPLDEILHVKHESESYLASNSLFKKKIDVSKLEKNSVTNDNIFEL